MSQSKGSIIVVNRRVHGQHGPHGHPLVQFVLLPGVYAVVVPHICAIISGGLMERSVVKSMKSQKMEVHICLHRAWSDDKIYVTRIPADPRRHEKHNTSLTGALSELIS